MAGLSLLERVFYAHVEAHAGDEGAGTPIGQDDPIFGFLQFGEWFAPTELSDIKSNDLDQYLTELKEELAAANSNSETAPHSFQVAEPGGDLLGWFVTIFNASAQCGYLLIDADGTRTNAWVDGTNTFVQQKVGP